MTVQRVETTIDNFGGETQTWTDRYLDVWCQPMAIGSSAAGGGEYNDDAQMQADAKYEFVCRYLPGVEYTDRIYWSGGYFDIYQIFPIGRREGMRIRGSWSDDQGDAWSMGGLNAEQVVSGTGGLTLSQVTAEYEANETGQTFPQLVNYYTAAESGEVFTGPLDSAEYSDRPLAASVRRLTGDYTGPCMRIRRVSDSTHLDIGFDTNGDLDTAAIEAFCSGTIGTVQTWYDQSGSRNHLTQDTLAQQPAIYDNGAVITRNGKPALIERDIANNGSLLINTSFSMGADYSASGVFGQSLPNKRSIAFATKSYNTSSNTFSSDGYCLLSDSASSSDSSKHSNNLFINGIKEYVYGSQPSRADMNVILTNGMKAVSLHNVNNGSSNNGVSINHTSTYGMMDTQEFIMWDNPGNKFAGDDSDDAFFAAWQANQMAYFNIT